MKMPKFAIKFIWLVVIVLGNAADGHAKTGILSTKHNLSASGLFDVRAITENKVCVFCHTPHNANPGTPLWNKSLDPTTYNLYESSTLKAKTKIQQPYGPTRLCLSCHDGTLALGKIMSSPDPIPFQTSEYVLSSLSTDISDDHPVAFSYYDAEPASAESELAATLPPDLLFYNGSIIHCSTCHDPHDDTFGMFLSKDNRESALCTTCHANKNGWGTSIHRTSINGWNGLGTNPWPRNDILGLKTPYYTVMDNGCLSCHEPHGADGKTRLLTSRYEEEVCFPCHNGNVAAKNIEAQFNKSFIHNVKFYTLGATLDAHDPAENKPPYTMSWHVECVDCHNPHAADDTSSYAPNITGASKHVTGVDENNIAVSSAAREYEICFKCHGFTNQDNPKINRVVNETDKTREFNPNNPSFHPVVAASNIIDVPSLTPPSTYRLDITPSSQMYCTDCHGDDSSQFMVDEPRGPHGSDYDPILRERYEAKPGYTESLSVYALCYRCHNQQSLLDDTLNQLYGNSAGHPGHIGGNVKASCATCHDPHGIPEVAGTGSHTHLINFDTDVVLPAPGETYPLFTDDGTRAGSCTLICHDINNVAWTHIPGDPETEPNHINSSYP